MSNLFGRGYQFVVTMFLGFLVCSFVFVDFNLVSAADNKPQPVATAVALRGDVVVKNADGKSRKLAAKDSLYLQDTISTGPRGRLQ
ncbi:MAG: hypothetical protein OEL66_09220, partial [Desulfobulbaceae bacterium]|nr:hypothetical protein [Desulfobulbaceae bacterium]